MKVDLGSKSESTVFHDNPIRYFSTKDSSASDSPANEKLNEEIKVCERRRNFYATVNNNVKRIEDRLLPKSEMRQQRSATLRRSSSSKQAYLPCKQSLCADQTSLININERHRQRESKHKKSSGSCTQYRRSRNLETIQENYSGERLRENNLNGHNATRYSVRTSMLDKVYLRQIPSKSGISCLIQDTDGSYRRKRAFLVPRRRTLLDCNVGKTTTIHSSSTSAKDTESSFPVCWSYATAPNRRKIIRSKSLPSSSLLNQYTKCHDSQRYKLSTSSDLSYALNRNNLCRENSTTLPTTFEAFEKQIDPTFTFLPQTEPTCPRPNNRASLWSRLLYRFRKIFAPKSFSDTNIPSSRSNVFSRFLSVFHSWSKNLETAERTSSISTPTRSNLFCWTCFEMDGDDETLSSVDSESGSDGNEDPDDGDGDVGCDNDDFNNQEDIEAIEYSSDGGGDGSDNSSCNNENDSFWQDDLMNQESNNYGLNDFDDCEDDEIEIARKAGFSFFDDREEDVDTQSIIGKRDWYYEMFSPGRHENEYETEILGLTDSRATEELDAFNFFV